MAASKAHDHHHHVFFLLRKLFSRRVMRDSCRFLFFLPIFLAFTSSIFLFFYSWSKSKLYIPLGLTTAHINPPVEFSKIYPSLHLQEIDVFEQPLNLSNISFQEPSQEILINPSSLLPSETPKSRPIENDEKNVDVFHDRSLFMEEYEEMKKKLKIYAYPHKKGDPFANIFLPSLDEEPGGNYASESYFKKSLFKSHFLTNDPSQADLFYLPFSIASLRHDKRIGVDGIQDFIRDYVRNISRTYPFWNRTGGADHFYVACHSIGRTAMDKAVEVKINAIQVVCSSSYFLSGYASHKDASIPQIWPRKGKPPTRLPSERKTLAFYAGELNSRVRKTLIKVWENDTDISVHKRRLETPYSEALLGSKFCIHAKGFEVNTARIGDALYYGCVPVVLADYYDLPFADILNWNMFSVVVPIMDIPLLKKILQEIVMSDEYLRLQENVMRVQKHFQWNDVPVDYDVFHMVMYELWLRRSHMRILI